MGPTNENTEGKGAMKKRDRGDAEKNHRTAECKKQEYGEDMRYSIVEEEGPERVESIVHNFQAVLQLFLLKRAITLLFAECLPCYCSTASISLLLSPSFLLITELIHSIE